MFNCEKCGKEFEFNCLLTRHLEKKLPCDTYTNITKNYDNKIISIDTEIETKTVKSLEEKTKCLFCDKLFLTKTNTNRHIKHYCLKKKELIEEKDKIIIDKNKLVEEKKNQDRDDEIKMLRDGFAKLLKKHSGPNINIINNNNNKIINNKVINNNLVVNINSFGKENLSHISLSDYKKYLSGYFPGFINFIEKVHFDENMPENNNLCITNLKSKFMYIHDGDKWVTKDKNDVINKFIKTKYNILSDKCDELGESNEIDEKTLDKFLSFAQNYKDEDSQKNTKDKIMLMIYNNKDKIKMK